MKPLQVETPAQRGLRVERIEREIREYKERWFAEERARFAALEARQAAPVGGQRSLQPTRSALGVQ